MERVNEVDEQEGHDVKGRAVCLDTAKGLILRDRNSSYGEPEQDFQCIADLWNAYLQHAGFEMERLIAPYEVGVLMALLKIGRITTSPSKDDHWFDLAGYAACSYELSVDKDQGRVVEDVNRMNRSIGGGK